MAETMFNLLKKPWIRVTTPDCVVHEVSLTEALMQAHMFSNLAGELPTQDIAILRLMLAVLHSVFTEVDENGKLSELKTKSDAYKRWGDLWTLGCFPKEPILTYLKQYEERFDLFHPERPFYQVKEAAGGTEFTAAKLNGAISESSNKIRLFSMRAGAQKDVLTDAEAARWLIYLNGYDDTSAKPKQKGLPSPGAGWLGKLGLIAAQGDNLFETLMLNWVLLDDEERLWGKNNPIWALDSPRVQERCEITMPDNQAELLTLQSRRLLLIRDACGVTGYKLLGGDFFSKVNALKEQMTLWTYVQGKGSQPGFYQPKRHDASKQIWREFSSVIDGANNREKPGVVKWQERLKRRGKLEKKRMSRFMVASVQYGDKDFFVADVFSDSLSFHLDLLTDAGADWVEAVEAEIRRTDKVAAEILYLGMNIDKAAGGDGDALGKQLKEQFYDRIDVPFRRFLEAVDPQDDEEQMHERLERWHEEEWRIAYGIAGEIVSQEDRTNFIIGNTIKEKQNGKEVSNHYSVPEAYKRFKYQINRLLKNKKGAAE